MGITLFRRPTARKEGADSEFAATVATLPPGAEAAIPLPPAGQGGEGSPDSQPPDSQPFDSQPFDSRPFGLQGDDSQSGADLGRRYHDLAIETCLLAAYVYLRAADSRFDPTSD